MTQGDIDSTPPVAFTKLFSYSTSFELFIDAVAIIAAIAGGAAQPLMSILFGNLVQGFVDFGTAKNTYLQAPNNSTVILQFQTAAAEFRHSASWDAVYLVFIGIGSFFCSYVSMIVWVNTGEANAKRIREKYLQAVLRQDVAYFDSVGAGEVATRIQSDTHLVQQSISEKVGLVAHYLSAFCTGYIVAYIRCWRLALALSSILPCMIITGAIMQISMTKYKVASLKNVAASSTIAEEVISTIRITQAFGTQRVLSGIYDGYIQRALFLDAKAASIHGVGVGVFSFIIYSAYALAFQFGTTLINEGYATAGDITNVILAILIGSLSIPMMSPDLTAILQGRSAATKLFATIERVPGIDSSDPSGLKPENVVGEITLQDVTFNYPSRPDVPILKGINLAFPARQTAALVGASGSGKSTIISLVERFYDPLGGTVNLDGADIRTLNIKWLRSQIGLVSQEPTLFATTIRGNVGHGLINTPYERDSEEAKFERVKEACIKANAHDFICTLPNGYDTMVGERGFLLSGGQKQRIAIARAIVSDPRILLLDEATSALDTQSEGIVQDALDKASAGRTTITIAHRLSTIKNADCIYVMGDGLVLEKGTHSELLADESSTYSRLVQAQKLREAKETKSDGKSITSSAELDTEKVDEKEVGLVRTRSDVSGLARKRNEEKKEKEDDEKKQGIFYLVKRIGQLHRRDVWRYAVGSIFTTVSGMVYPVFGIVFGHIINDFSQVNPSVRRQDGNRNALWFFIIAIVNGITAAFQTYLFDTSAVILTSNLCSLSFKAILRQDTEFFDKEENNAGTLTVNLVNNPRKLNGLAGITLGTIMASLVTVVGGMTIGLVYAYKVALVGLACFPFILTTGYIRLRVVVLKDQQNKRAHENSSQVACEAAASIRTVASLTREDDCLRMYSDCLEEPLRRSNAVSIWSSMLYSVSESCSFFVIALVFWYGADLVSRLEISVTAFFVSLMSTVFAAIQTGTVFAWVPDISSARIAGGDIIKLIDSVPEIDAESTEGETFDEKIVRGEIGFKRVYFRYPTRPSVRVLQDLSLTVKPGTYVALVGASGCGKSTIIQLIERFYDPLAGYVFLDGKPINELNVQEYRKQIALVSQEPTLYAGTIRFNVLLGATKPEQEVTQEELEAVCRDANILEFIQSLPDGFETQVGGKGSQLSGGQKQRIAIARALLRNPKVLLLDEATSALDSNSEKIVQEALDRAARGRTTIAIAHRLSTIQNADCIYFVKEGRVSEAGTHDELLSLRGDYYEYVQLQALNKE